MTAPSAFASSLTCLNALAISSPPHSTFNSGRNLAEHSAESYSTGVPTWVHIILVLAWGWLMWRLWVWVDGRINKKNHGTDKQD